MTKEGHDETLYKGTKIFSEKCFYVHGLLKKKSVVWYTYWHQTATT